MIKKLKDIFKLFLNVISPKAYIKFLKFRYFIVNDLTIRPIEEYSAYGVFPTMHTSVPKYYCKWISSRVFDDNGIVLWEKYGKLWYNPVQIIQFGLSEYGYYINNKKEEHFMRAIAAAKWLVDNQEKDTGKWLYHFDYFVETSKETLIAPWACAMAQGEGIALLVRIYTLDKKSEYLDTAIRAMYPLNIPIEEGGLQANIFNMPIYEEYPTKVYSHVLNGFMFCLIGLHDFYELCGNDLAKRLYETGIETVKKILPLYDSEYTSYYDLGHITCSPHNARIATKYDPIHVNLLQTINIFEHDEVIEFYSKKWARGLLGKCK